MNHKQLLQQAIDYAKLNKSFNKYNVVMNAENVCVFGLGTYFKEAFAQKNMKSRYHVNLLCDNNPERWGTCIEGIPCVKPDELTQYSNLVVIIMLGNPSPVCEQLSGMGIRWVTHTDLSIDEELGFSKDEDEIATKEDVMLSTMDLFADEESKRIYANALANRIALGMACPWTELYSQGEYFEQKFMKLTNQEVFVDCGAYDGDTVLRFAEVVKDYEHIYAFELDKKNYDKMIKNTEGLNKISYYNKGVFDENTDITYSLGDGANEPMDGISIMKNSGKQQVAQVAKLDDKLGNKKITFVKMDIEGSEVKALKGMKQIIETQSPKLAICVYHKTSDFWEVPMLIKQYHPEYQLYLRHHFVNNCWGTVCYAVV
ncbi:MAG: FkbM family methyltransferase [bacterium]|nr:FkbM family methyltransferase [bacterium]